jgi:large conductance mechanosensitive channel
LTVGDHPSFACETGRDLVTLLAPERGEAPVLKHRGLAMLKEFKEFAMRGSVLDMAIGIIIGGAFGKIITSLVGDIIMPPIGLLLGKVNFNDLYFSLDGKIYPSLAAAKAAGAPTINYGMFVNTILDFVIVAFVIFLLIRQMNRLMPAAPAAPPATKDCAFCASSIPMKALRCPNCTSQLAA